MTTAAMKAAATADRAAERADRRRARGTRPSHAAMKQSLAGRPTHRLAADFADRLAPGCSPRCLTCFKTVCRGGPCPGVRPTDRTATPLCHVDLLTGRREFPFEVGPAGQLIRDEEARP